MNVPIGAQPSSPLPAAVLWDMDGTLVDTEPYWIAAEHRLVAAHGNGRWTDELGHQLVGRDLRDSARFIQRHGGVRLAVDDIVNWLLGAVIDDVRRAIPWRPGARRLLDELRDAQVPCALVTMSWRSLATAVVDGLAPDTFAAVITGDDVHMGKPHPESYITAAKALWVEPHQCVALEDSPTGVAAALAAGCRTVAIPHMVDIPAQPGLIRIRSLEDVNLAWLDSLFTSSPAAGGFPPPGAPAGTQGVAEPAAVSRRTLLIGGAVVAVAAAAAVALLGGDDEPPPPPDIPIAAWVPYWQLEAATASLRANSRMLTSVSPFWFEINADGGPDRIATSPQANSERTAAFLKLARDRKLKILPAVVDQTSSGTMAAVLADRAARQGHVQALARFAADGGYDGLDIDYEKFAFADPRSTWAATRPLFSAFIDELAARLHADGRTLSVAVPYILGGGTTDADGYWVYDYAAIAESADQIRIMAYDYSFDAPGPLSPLPWVTKAVRAARKVTGKPERLSLGVPLYGYSWATSITGTCPDGTPTGKISIMQRSLADLVARRKANTTADATNAEDVVTYTAGFPDDKPTCHQQRQINIVTAAGARTRIDLARKERLGGVSLWALGFDAPDTWAEIRDLARDAAASTTTTRP